MTADRKMQITETACGNCRHFARRSDFPDQGECRRRAPHLSTKVPGWAVWPAVPADARCGKHELGALYAMGRDAS